MTRRKLRRLIRAEIEAHEIRKQAQFMDRLGGTSIRLPDLGCPSGIRTLSEVLAEKCRAP